MVYVYRTTFSTVIRTFLGEGGGRLLEGGRLLNILSLKRGAYSKGGAYWKLGAYSSIYGIPYYSKTRRIMGAASIRGRHLLIFLLSSAAFIRGRRLLGGGV